tara:strand:+ start:457 stop:621 length:165 start_codon:yes stop_codon:yes gene_type:complete
MQDDRLVLRASNDSVSAGKHNCCSALDVDVFCVAFAFARFLILIQLQFEFGLGI